MSTLGDLSSPLAVLGVVVLVLLFVSRGLSLFARLGIWVSERVGGPEDLYGEDRVAEGRLPRFGEARTDLSPRGKVFVSGELWDAVAEGRIAAGDRVEVVDLEGLELRVRSAGDCHDQD